MGKKKTMPMGKYAKLIDQYNDFLAELAKVCGNKVIDNLERRYLIQLMRAKSRILTKASKIEDEMERIDYITNTLLSVLAGMIYKVGDTHKLNIDFDKL